jgi:hypothetical protein
MNSSLLAKMVAVAHHLGVARLHDVDDYEDFLEAVKSEDLVLLKELYNSLSTEDNAEILDWIQNSICEKCGSSEYKHVWYLLLFIEILADRTVLPFVSGKLHRLSNAPPDLNWLKLPSEFHYVISAANKFGTIQFEEQIDCFARYATKVELSELSSVAMQTRCDMPDLVEWMTKHSLVEHPEARLLYFLLSLLNELGLS